MERSEQQIWKNLYLGVCLQILSVFVRIMGGCFIANKVDDGRIFLEPTLFSNDFDFQSQMAKFFIVLSHKTKELQVEHGMHVSESANVFLLIEGTKANPFYKLLLNNDTNLR